MARAPITPIALLRDGAVAQGAGATPAAAATGNVVASPGPFRTLIVVNNAAASGSVTMIVRGAGYTGTPGGAANSSVVSPANTVFTQGTVGDLSVAVGFGTTQVVQIDTTDRFAQPDGSMLIDFTSPTSMTVWVYQLPFVQPGA
jgi:hypothetical protein